MTDESLCNFLVLEVKLSNCHSLMSNTAAECSNETTRSEGI